MSDQPFRAICIAGPSDAGKTSLIEALVPRLSAFRVGTIKSIHHDIDPDTSGADTHRHRQAGAETVVGITPTLSFEFTTGGKQHPPPNSDAGWLVETDDPELRALESTLGQLAHRGYELVLIEGFSASPLPTIVVGDRSTTGPVIGSDSDDTETLAEAITSVEPLAVPRL